MSEMFPETKKAKAEKMVKVKINMTTVHPDFDITMGCKEDESLTDSELEKRPHINVARERQKFFNQILQAGEELEVPESVAKAWESEVYYLPAGVFGVINSSQLGLTAPRLLANQTMEDYSRQVEEFGKMVDEKIKIKITRATIIG